MSGLIKPFSRAHRLSDLVAIVPLVCAILAAGASVAQPFPSKPLRIVVPAAPGGNLDNITRIVAQKLQEQLGQPVIVDNRPGGNYKIAVDAVAKSPPDGYTYLAIADSFLIAPAISKAPGYDPLKDFVGVSITAWVPQILVVNPSVPANSVKELIALAKKSPGELTYGSAGSGFSGHIAAELFSMQAGIKMTHVPYKGNAPALVDLVGGRLSLMFDTISTSLPHVKSGKLRALGVTTPTRSPLLPDVPTVSEAGLPGYEAAIFNGFVAHAATPPDILRGMQAEIRKIVQQADLRARLLEQGVDLAASESPEQFSAFLKSQSDKYIQVIKAANIRAD
jgi:tripartite-type tricarboxylate transporter receptor subunit TctC